MVYSTLAVERHTSPKHSSRQGASIDTFLIHHMASTDGPGTSRMMIGPSGRTVSANYTIMADGRIIGVVPEELRAWTSGAAGDGGRGAAWDRRSITVEIENESGDPDWRISSAALNAAAALLKDLRKRYPIVNVLGHRDLYSRFGASYPTYCPGPNTVATIVALAGGNPQAATGVAPASGGRNATSRPTADVQRLVGATPDGIYGPDTSAKVKAWQKAHGLEADGIWGPLSDAKGFPEKATAKPGPTAPAFPLPAGSYFGPKEGPAQSVSGYFSHRADLKAWQARMVARGWVLDGGADGLYGPATREVSLAFQREKGLVVDGLIGPATWGAAWTAPVS